MSTYNIPRFSMKGWVTCVEPAVTAYRPASYKSQPGGHLLQGGTLALRGQIKCFFPRRFKSTLGQSLSPCHHAFLCLSPSPGAELPLKGRQLDLSPARGHRGRVRWSWGGPEPSVFPFCGPESRSPSSQPSQHCKAAGPVPILHLKKLRLREGR